LAEAASRLRQGKAGLLPRRGRGIAILFRFFTHGGRQLVLRVPVNEPRPDGLRTVPVRVTLQPDGDVLVALPREEVDSGHFDANSARRLAVRLRQLGDRAATANPLWGLDASQALGEIASAAAGLVSGVLLLRNGFEELTNGVMAHAGATVALLLLPFVMVKLRPWLTQTVLPSLMARMER